MVVYTRSYDWSLIKELRAMKLFDSELKVMNVLWREGEATAKHVSDVLKASVGWNINTTYTILKRLIEKGAVERSEPGFRCRPLVDKASVQQQETDDLIDRVFDGSADKLFASLLSRKKLSPEEIEGLKRLVDELE